MVDTNELPGDDDHVEGGVPVGVLVVRVSSLKTQSSSYHGTSIEMVAQNMLRANIK